MDIIVSTKFVFYIDYYYNYYIKKPKRIKLLIIYLPCIIDSCSQTIFPVDFTNYYILNVLPFIAHMVIRSARTTNSNLRGRNLSEFKLHKDVQYKPTNPALNFGPFPSKGYSNLEDYHYRKKQRKRSFELRRKICVYVDVFILCL